MNEHKKGMCPSRTRQRHPFVSPSTVHRAHTTPCAPFTQGTKSYSGISTEAHSIPTEGQIARSRSGKEIRTASKGMCPSRTRQRHLFVSPSTVHRAHPTPCTPSTQGAESCSGISTEAYSVATQGQIARSRSGKELRTASIESGKCRERIEGGFGVPCIGRVEKKIPHTQSFVYRDSNPRVPAIHLGQGRLRNRRGSFHLVEFTSRLHVSVFEPVYTFIQSRVVYIGNRTFQIQRRGPPSLFDIQSKPSAPYSR
ncbi:hypothetical protein IW261DRAFT_361600 [Armillaria novae-zelandiae]|uniref:Uncharacterized protein n=1 Tax=Armillaria novae-zelandiae TaxID=153914 RepID=A0AA39PS26_9AGAR|nr:hypothetical protein IW261DRAFT_361600 [Armillaria novae-zelandiae]